MEELRKQTETLPLAPVAPSPTPMPLPLSAPGPTTVPGAPTGEDRFQQLIREAAQRRDGVQPAVPTPAPDPKAAMDAFIAMQGAAPTDLGIPEFMPTVTPKPRLTPQQHGARLEKDVIAPWELLDVYSETGWELAKQIPKIATGRWDELEAPVLFTQDSYLAGEKASIESFQSRPWWQQIILGIVFDPFGPPVGAGTLAATTKGLLRLATKGIVKGARIPFKSRRLAVELLEEGEDGIKIKPELEITNPEIIQESVNNMPAEKIAFIYGKVDEDAGAYIRFFDESELPKFQDLEARGLGIIQYKGQRGVTNQFRNYRERVHRSQMDEDAALPYEPAPGPEVVAPEPIPAPARAPERAPARAVEEPPMSLEQLEAEYRRLDPQVSELGQQADAAITVFDQVEGYEKFLNSLRALAKNFDERPGQIPNSVLNRLMPSLRLPRGSSSFEALDPIASQWNTQWNLGVAPGPENKVLVDDVLQAAFRQIKTLDSAKALVREAAEVKQQFGRIQRRMKAQGIKEGVGAIDQPRSLDVAPSPAVADEVVDEFLEGRPRGVTEIEGPSGYLPLPIQMAKENNPTQLLHAFKRIVWYEGNNPDDVMEPSFLIKQAWDGWINVLQRAHLEVVGTDHAAAALLEKIQAGVRSIPIDSLTTRQVMRELDNLLDAVKNRVDYTPPGAVAPSPAETTPRVRIVSEDVKQTRIRIIRDKPRVRVIEESPLSDPLPIDIPPSAPGIGVHRVYHGTDQVFDAFDEGAQSINALYGPGVYTTESASVASRYAITKSMGLDVPVPDLPFNVWSMDIAVTKFLDIDAVPDKELLDILRSEGHWTYELPPNWTNHDLYQFLTKQFGDKASVNDWLINHGYDTITHIGGVRTGTDPHRVWVSLDSKIASPAFGSGKPSAATMIDPAEIVPPPAAAPERAGLFGPEDVVPEPLIQAVPSPKEMAEGGMLQWIVPDTDVRAIIDQHGEFMVVVKDVNGHRAMMKASDFLKLQDNQAFMDRVREVFVNRNYDKLRDTIEATDGFMKGLVLRNILDEVDETLLPGALPGGELADISGVKLTSEGSVFPAQKEKFVVMITNSGIRRVLTSLGIKEVKLEPPYKFGLGEQGNYSPSEGIIRINIDAEDPTHTMFHELGHALLEEMDETALAALLQRAKLSTDPTVEGLLSLARRAERTGAIDAAGVEDEAHYLLEAAVNLVFTDPTFNPDIFARLSIEDRIIEHAPRPRPDPEQAPGTFMQQGMDLGEEAGAAPPIQGGLDMGAAGRGVEQTPLLDADQIAQKAEINRQRKAGQGGMFDDMEGLAQLERINGTPGTQYVLEVSYGRPAPLSTTTVTVEGISRTQHRWMVKTDMVESRRAFQEADNLEEFNFQEEVVGWITKFEDEDVYRIHALGDTIADPGVALGNGPSLQAVIRGIIWDVNNNQMAFKLENGTIVPFGEYGGGGGSWRRRHIRADYTGEPGQLRLHRDINEAILNLRKRKQLLQRIAGEADQPARAVARMRAQISQEADRLTALLNNIVDATYEQITTVPSNQLRRAAYTETSTVTAVSSTERSGLLISRGAEVEMQGMGRNVTEQALEAQQRLGDHRYTKQLLEKVINEQEEGWEGTVSIIREDLEDEANALGILADLMAEEGSDASRGLVRGLRDEIYDEIGTVDPKFQGGWGSMYEQAGGGRTARPPGGWAGEDPALQRQLDQIMERAAQNGERIQYPGTGPMADDEIGRFADSPPPPRIPTIVSEPGQGFIRLPNLRHIREFLTQDIVDETNPMVQWIYQYTPMNWVDKSVNAITPAAKLKIAYMMAQVADDQYLEVLMQSVWDVYAKSAPRTFFGKRIPGPLRKLLPGTGIMDIPINWKTGSWGDSGIQWNDIWENYNGIHKAQVDKYADRLDGNLRKLIAEFANIVNTEVENLRKINGLPERRRFRPVGEVYFPRKGVRKYDEATKRYYDFEKPSNPNHERLWMTAQDVYEKHGIDFMSDPRAVLELHVRQALKEIRHFQMEEMIEELGFAVKVSELVDPAIVAARADALGAWQAAQKALKAAVRAKYGEELQTRIGKLIADMNIDLGLDADISRAQAALRAERGTVRADLAGEVLKLTADESRAKIAFYQARQNYRKAVNRARDREYIQLTDDHSPLWGGTLKAGIHPITPNRFKTKFFLTEDAQHIEDYIKGLDPDNAGVTATTFNTLANTSRFLASVGDFAMPFQHLLPVMWRRPDVWVNATFNHYRAFWDPTVQARLVRDNIDDYWELALNGVPVGDPEFFAALSPGQGIDFDAILRKVELKGLENMSGVERTALKHVRSAQRLGRGLGRQTFGRFQTSYQTGLGFARVLLYKALKNNKKWASDKNQLFSYIRNMTGGLDSRRLGIGPTQRGVEGMWIAFSPRLLRSTLALTSDAIQAAISDPGLIATAGFKEVTGRASARQTESFNTIRNMIAGVFTLYTVTGLAMGKDWDEIKQGMNPLNGRRFLSYQINGDWIGVGGQMRALMQFQWSLIGLLSRQRGEYSDLMSMNMMKNPFIYFFMSRGAPGITLGGTAIESFTPIDILPFDDPDGGLDFLAHYGTNSAPFALQHYLESRTWESAAMEMFGARASFNPRDRAVSYITGGEESVYADQPPMIKWLVNEMIDDGTSFDSIEMKRRKELLSLPRSGLSYMEWKSIEDKFSGRRGQAAEEEDFGKNDINDPDPMKRAMAQYYELFRHPRVRDAEGISMPNGDEIFSRLFRAKANLSVEQGGWGWTTDQAKHVIANTNRRPVPWFVLSQVSGARKDSIIRSQRMREQMFIEMGRKDLAMISHRLFYMLPPEVGAYSEEVDRLVEGGPHEFGPYMYDEAWGHQEQRLEDIEEAGGALGRPNLDIERVVGMAR